MKLTRYLLGICLLVCSMQGSAKDKDGKAALYVIPCADYVKDYATQVNGNLPKRAIHVDFLHYAGFVKGYVNAANMYRENGLQNIRSGHSWATVYLYVDKYCRDNPLAHIINALSSFVYEMEHK